MEKTFVQLKGELAQQISCMRRVKSMDGSYLSEEGTASLETKEILQDISVTCSNESEWRDALERLIALKKRSTEFSVYGHRMTEKITEYIRQYIRENLY